MKRTLLMLTAVALASAFMSLSVQARRLAELKSVRVTLPESTRALPEGPGLATVRNNCLGCHSAGMILNQPRMAKAAWAAEAAKMRNVYKAPVNEKDVAAIVDYLTAVKGPK
jgi:cytochrome c5